MKTAAALAATAALVGAGGLGAELVKEDGPSCRSQARPAIVDLHHRKHARVLDHAHDAIRAGHPRNLHIDRHGADENRRQSLRGIRPKPGRDRDEYPPAVSLEGGTGASVRHIPSAENRSAGSTMGRQLRPYCNAQPFQLEPGR